VHVGLNLVYLVPDSGGSATYARGLIRGLHEVAPDVRITAWVNPDTPELDGVERVRLPVRGTGSAVHIPMELFGLGLDARRRGVDVVHGLAYTTPIVAPDVATVVTLLDLTWRHEPQSVSWRARVMFGLLAPLCGTLADRVVAISEHARDDLVRTLGIEPAKIEVTPLGVDPLPPRPRDPDGPPLLLVVGQVAAHKNLLALVEALPEIPDARVVIAGRRTPYADALEARAAALGVADRLELTGYVSDEELEALWAQATAFVLPSRHEGFGLPVLEAMARGVPVACSDASALPETAGGAALLFDPASPSSIAAACTRLLGDAALRASLTERGLERAGRLTWAACAEATLRAYRRAIASRTVRGGGSTAPRRPG
jgi:glycosyltransferase involved in cell wall biosynthesis